MKPQPRKKHSAEGQLILGSVGIFHQEPASVKCFAACSRVWRSRTRLSTEADSNLDTTPPAGCGVVIARASRLGSHRFTNGNSIATRWPALAACGGRCCKSGENEP